MCHKQNKYAYKSDCVTQQMEVSGPSETLVTTKLHGNTSQMTIILYRLFLADAVRYEISGVI
jgi:hypothetical protein